MAVADLSKVLWLRGKDLGSAGTSVASWVDQSGTGHNATAVGTAPTVAAGVTPSGGKAVKFAQSGRVSTTTSGHLDLGDLGLTGAGEAWVVVKAPAQAIIDTPASPGLWTFNVRAADATVFPYWDTTNSQKVFESFGVGSGQRVTYTSGVSLESWRLYRVQKTTGTLKIWVDGTLIGTYTGKTTTWPTQYLLGRALASSSSFDAAFGGWVAELIVRPAASTDAEAAELVAYFNTEHGLSVPGGSTASLLSATHPAHTAAMAGTVPVSGSVAAAASSHTAALTGDVQVPVDGTLTATREPHTAALTGDVPTPATRLDPWTGDLSQRTRLVLKTSGSVDALPALELPPTGFVERPVMRKSVTVPALDSITGAIIDPATGVVRVPDDVYSQFEDAAVVEEVGVPHIVFPNMAGLNDVTYFRGGITRILRDRREEPFGDVSMVLELPQVTSFDEEADSPTNDSPMNWTRNRANAEIVLRKSDGTVTRGVWTGHVVSHDTGNDATSTTKTLTCQGTMWQAATDVHKVPNMLDPTDVGTLIPKALNTVSSRRYPRLPNVSTGILSKQRGTWSDSPMAYAQSLLATAHTVEGRQWTVSKVEGSRRTYQMRLKKTAPSWTVTNGARGVDVALTRDATVVRNVIYGHGVGADGYAWWNYHYPNLRMDDAPAYPYSSASTVMSVGSTDAGTVSGEGVTVWQERARDLGYNVTVNGTFDGDDATAAGAIQRRYGLQVDNIVGPQTWAATFDVGGNGGDLTGAIRLPLAADPRTQRWLYNADGSVAGENPDYDPNVIVYAADVDFGAGVTREEGIESAQQIVDRESEPGLTGRITLRTDPREGSRILIPPGDKITLVGFEGADRVLHITAVERDWANLTVTLEVDEKSRDAMTLAQIRERNREARRDPARRPGNVNRRSRLDVDQVVPFDGESGAGWIPRHAIYGGLWTVVRIPVSELGRIAKVDVRTSGPASKFALALFGAPIQPAHLVKYVGNPLTSDNPYEANAELLQDRFGFIEGWGQSGQAAGYWPSSEGEGSLTGRLVDAGGIEYVSAKPPWVWVAEFAATSTFISGRILPAPIQ